jgi:hypothetical protein
MNAFYSKWFPPGTVPARPGGYLTKFGKGSGYFGAASLVTEWRLVRRER